MVTGLPHSPLAECCGADPAVYDEVGSYILLQLLHSFRSTDFFVVLSYYLYKQNRGRAWPPYEFPDWSIRKGVINRMPMI